MPFPPGTALTACSESARRRPKTAAPLPLERPNPRDYRKAASTSAHEGVLCAGEAAIPRGRALLGAGWAVPAPAVHGTALRLKKGGAVATAVGMAAAARRAPLCVKGRPAATRH
eukprot:313929-Chlamydomonas_euryale.AAC.5